MDEFSEIEFKCIPGRTIIKYEAPKEVEPVQESDELDARRYHMNWINYGQQKDNTCKMCVCSAEGKDEYCVRRPAINTNECLRLNDITKEYSKNIAFDHERDLSQRMRREWIWHHDEIPYEGASKCYRGMSYYTNNIKANDTTLAELESDVESFLDYENKTVCYFCICHTSGDKIACISRDPYFCDYHRMLSRDQDAVRDMYTHDFGEDRPAYFRLLSQRMRRTMDEGVYDLIDTGGDTLCCEHPSGHRKSLHQSVRKRVWQNLRHKIPRENLLGQRPALNGDYVDFVVNNDKKK
ncbi:hypothetical protein O0L34_g17759 [Tuta absoluta]|nr:hypothetical protein O0L34_g17759 [Tuta absoluta]